MGKRRKEPRWLTRLVVDAIQADQIREHGGAPRVGDEDALESALAPGYGFGLVRNHPYRDGNKRAGLLAVVTFLGINGLDFDASESEVVSYMVRLADGSFTEQQFADWVRPHIHRPR